MLLDASLALFEAMWRQVLSFTAFYWIFYYLAKEQELNISHLDNTAVFAVMLYQFAPAL